MYLNGVTVHTSTPRVNPVAGIRGETKGWTSAVAARQKKWLYTVDAGGLDGDGFALTLTVGECPVDAATWAAMRRSWFARIEKKFDVSRLHWVTEWQRRMVPHMHVAVYVQPGDDEGRSGSRAFTTHSTPFLAVRMVVEWLLVCDAFGIDARLSAQDAKSIDNAGGWFKYMSKHAARGANHYQRQGHPEGWNKTGRMWGHTGQWPTVEPYEFPKVSRQEFYQLRRTFRHWARNQASLQGDFSRLAFLRRAPGRVPKNESRFQAVSEWIPESEVLRLVDHLER
jgi:hypothetical protein